MMTGFLAVQGIEVHAETQQTTGEAASAVESVELDAEIIENSDVTDADGKAGPEELLPEVLPDELPPDVLPDATAPVLTLPSIKVPFNMD